MHQDSAGLAESFPAFPLVTIIRSRYTQATKAV